MTEDFEQKTKAIQEKILPPKEEETYKVFEFFSKNIPLLLTVASAVVAVSVAFVNLLSYLIEHRYLEYWNIDTSILQINNKTTTFYTIVISITYSLAISLIGLLLPKFLQYMYVHDITRLYYKLRLKCTKRNLKAILRNIKQWKKQHKKNSKRLDKLTKKCSANTRSEDLNEIKNIENEIAHWGQAKQSYDSEKDKILDSIKKIRIDLRRERILRFLTMFMYVLQFGGLVYLVNILYASSISIKSTNPLLIALVLLLIEVILAYIVCKIVSFVKRCKYKIKTSIMDAFDSEKTDDRTAMDLTIALANLSITSDIHKTTSEKLKKLASDKSIKDALMQIVLIICISAVSFFITNEIDIKNDKTYPITIYDNNDYAVIYNDGNAIILEDVLIDGNKIKIYTNSQCLLSPQELSYKIIEFQEVEIIRESIDSKPPHVCTKGRRYNDASPIRPISRR